MRLSLVLLSLYCVHIVSAQTVTELRNLLSDLIVDSLQHESADYYVLGVMTMDNPVVLQDTISGFTFIKNIKNHDRAEINTAIKQNNQQLLNSGWSITLTRFPMFFNVNFKVFKENEDYWWYCGSESPLDHIENVNGNKRYEVGLLPKVPNFYLLILVKGQYLQQITYDRVLDPFNDRFKFKDPQAYYQIIMPIYRVKRGNYTVSSLRNDKVNENDIHEQKVSKPSVVKPKICYESFPLELHVIEPPKRKN